MSALPIQADLFAPFEEPAVVEAVEAAGSNADPDWMAAAIEAVRCVSQAQATFTSDDVREWLAEHKPHLTTHNMSALGNAMKRAERVYGWCAPTGYMVRSRLGSHHRKVTSWASKIHVVEL